jgi:hypothetical protein
MGCTDTSETGPTSAIHRRADDVAAQPFELPALPQHAARIQPPCPPRKGSSQAERGVLFMQEAVTQQMLLRCAIILSGTALISGVVSLHRASGSARQVSAWASEPPRAKQRPNSCAY